MNQIHLTILIAAFACSALAAEFHVAPTGNDANPGTAEKPFATLRKARDAVRSSMRPGAPIEGVTAPWYVGRDPSDRGHLIRYNFFHDCGNPKRMQMGIYCDDGACGVTDYGNVFYKFNFTRKVCA